MIGAVLLGLAAGTQANMVYRIPYYGLQGLSAGGTELTPVEPARVFAAWDAGSKGPQISLSGDELTAAHQGANGWNSVRANVGLSRGKWYWETKLGPAGGQYHIQGIAGVFSGSAAIYSHGAGLAFNGTPGLFVRDYAAGASSLALSIDEGDVFSYALDMDTGTLKMAHNCQWLSLSPLFTGVSGTVYPVASLLYTTHSTITANFGQSTFACGVPSGYNAGVWAN